MTTSKVSVLTRCFALIAALFAAACSGDESGDKGPMERAGQTIDKAADATGDAFAAAYLHSKARVALFDKVGMDAARIDIDVKGDAVTLKGTVKKRETKELAKETVENMKGVTSVTDRLVLDTSDGAVEELGNEAKDLALKAKVRVALFDAVGSHALAIDIDVAGGTVVLSGTFGTDADHEAALKAVRAVDGVEKVENDLRKTTA